VKADKCVIPLSGEVENDYIIEFELSSNQHYEEVMVSVNILNGVNSSLGSISKLFEWTITVDWVCARVTRK